MSQISHLKIHGFSGDHLLERCEDDGCTVDERGNADCGRLACPSCGFSGSNLNAPDGFDGDTLARCTCGYAWTPEPDRVSAAA
jgi:hypothetical protein